MGAAGAEVLDDREWDAVVVGAGPAGLAAARVLAAAGASVLVVEEHQTIGDPVHCTGVIGLDAFDEIQLPRETICTVVRSARFHGSSGASVVVHGTRIAAAVVDRGRFDRALADRARDAGAAIATGLRVLQMEVDARGVSVMVQDESHQRRIRARASVLACGAQYRFNRRLGLGIPRAYLQSAQIETPFAPAENIDVDLDRSIASRGFAWMVPFRRGASAMARIGLMTADGAAVRFRRYADLLARRHALPALTPRPRVKLLPLGPVARTWADRILAVGDAAGLVKPTTGGGIYFSVLSGQLAGEVLADALARDRLDGAALRRYEGLWQARLGPELRAGLAFRTLTRRFDDRAIEALLCLAKSDGIVPLLQRTADFNFHRSAALALLRNPGFRRIVLASLWT